MPTQFPYPEKAWSEGFMRKAKAVMIPRDQGGDLRQLEGERKKRETRASEASPEQLQGMSPQEQFMYQHHQQNLQRGGVQQQDGKTSTYRAIGVEADGKYYMIPTIWDNKQLSNQDAIKRAKHMGMDKFPNYGSREEAEGRYNQLHDIMEQDLAGPRGTS